jgi:hypothetical protein
VRRLPEAVEMHDAGAGGDLQVIECRLSGKRFIVSVKVPLNGLHRKVEPPLGLLGGRLGEENVGEWCFRHAVTDWLSINSS